MEISGNCFTGEMIILFEEDENPLEYVPADWEIIERTEPEYFKGMLNPGRIVCRAMA